jgi:hypothetical protein
MPRMLAEPDDAGKTARAREWIRGAAIDQRHKASTQVRAVPQSKSRLHWGDVSCGRTQYPREHTVPEQSGPHWASVWQSVRQTASTQS